MRTGSILRSDCGDGTAAEVPERANSRPVKTGRLYGSPMNVSECPLLAAQAFIADFASPMVSQGPQESTKRPSEPSAFNAYRPRSETVQDFRCPFIPQVARVQPPAKNPIDDLPQHLPQIAESMRTVSESFHRGSRLVRPGQS
jgi:hypothetical protein